MAYNYTYPYMTQQNVPVYGNNNYQPMSNIGSQNQPVPNPYYQTPYAGSNQRFGAFFVNDYSEVKNATVSADGSPTLFMMNDKDVFYIKKVGEDGRTILKSYKFSEYIEDEQVETTKMNTNTDSREEDITLLKNEVKQIKETLSSLIGSLTASLDKKTEENKEGGKIKNAKQFSTNDF